MKKYSPACMACNGAGVCEGSPPFRCNVCGGTGFEVDLKKDGRCSDCPRRWDVVGATTECAVCDYMNRRATLHIEDKIPIPAAGRCGRKKGSGAYAWIADLKVGQSFVAPPAPGDQGRLNEAIRKQAKDSGVKITSRKDIVGFRVWRIA